MEQAAVKNSVVKTIKGFALSFLLFLILSSLMGVLIRFSGAPERWVSYYVLGALCAACVFLGMYTGNLMKKRGLLFGGLYSVIFLMIILAGAMLLLGSGLEFQLSALRYLICILFGSVGGMIGVNIR